MANELQTKLDAILNDKNTNLLPEHLKAGVTCLGVEGSYERVLTQEEYNICNNLATIALGETPLVDDLNIDVTLDVTNNETVKVENNTLIIEEVTE